MARLCDSHQESHPALLAWVPTECPIYLSTPNALLAHSPQFRGSEVFLSDLPASQTFPRKAPRVLPLKG